MQGATADVGGSGRHSHSGRSGTQTARYVHGSASDEMLTKTDSSGNVIYYPTDGLGSITKLTSSTEAVLEQYSYDVYGKATIKNASGTVIAVTAYANRFLFTGREYVASLSLYNYRARLYPSQIGRFLQTDPTGHNGDTYNLYRYCGDNPVSKDDPSGKDYYSATQTSQGVGDLDPAWDAASGETIYGAGSELAAVETGDGGYIYSVNKNSNTNLSSASNSLDPNGEELALNSDPNSVGQDPFLVFAIINGSTDNNLLNDLWSFVGNNIPGSGLSNMAELKASSDANIEFANQWTETGIDPESEFFQFSDLADQYYNISKDDLSAFNNEKTSSYIGDEVSGYRAFGLEGAEGLSATATTGLIGGVAVGGALIGYGISQIPMGNGMNLGQQLGQGMSNAVPGFWDGLAQ